MSSWSVFTMNGRKEAPSVSLGTHSARGLVYLFAGSTAAKVIGFATQIILLYLLGPTDFGVVFLAYTIATFIQVIEQAGIGDVLVRRRHFRIWSIPGFWFSLTLGAVSCLLVAMSALSQRQSLARARSSASSCSGCF